LATSGFFPRLGSCAEEVKKAPWSTALFPSGKLQKRGRQHYFLQESFKKGVDSIMSFRKASKKRSTALVPSGKLQKRGRQHYFLQKGFETGMQRYIPF